MAEADVEVEVRPSIDNFERLLLKELKSVIAKVEKALPPVDLQVEAAVGKAFERSLQKEVDNLVKRNKIEIPVEADLAPNFARDLNAEVDRLLGRGKIEVPVSAEVGATFERDLQRSIDRIVGDGIDVEIRPDLGAGFTAELGRQVGEAMRRVGPIDLDVDPTVDRTDIARVEGDLDKAGEKGAGGFGRGLRSAVLLAGGALAGLGLGKMFGDAIGEAADLGESINAIQVVLGPAAAGFLEFGETAAQNLGLTQSALNQAIVPSASILKNAGLEGDALSNSLEDLAQRATDVGSVFNEDTTVVLDAFGSALRGEMEPARRFGVQLNEAAIKAKAVEMGLADANGEVSQAAKTQATLALVLEQTNQAAGDFENTADSLPNTMKRLQASWTEASGALGVPLLNPLATLADEVIGSLDVLKPAMEELGTGVGEALAPVGGLIANVVTGIAPIIGSLGPVLGQLVQTVSLVLSAGLDALAPVFVALAPAVTQVVAVLGNGLAATLVALAPVLLSIAEVVAVVVDALAGGFIDVLNAVMPTITMIAEVIATLVSQLAGPLSAVIEAVAPVIAQLGGILAEVLLDTLVALMPAFTAITDAITAAAPSLGVLGEALVAIVEAVVPILPAIAELIAQLVVGLAPILPVIVEAIVAVASAMSGVLITVISSLLSALEPVLPVLVEVAGVLAGALATAIPVLVPLIEQIAAVMGETLGSVIESLAPALPALADAILQIALAFADLLIDLLPVLPPLLDLFVLFVENVSVPMMLLLADAIVLIAEALGAILPVVADLLGGSLGETMEIFAELFAALADGDWGEVADLVLEALGRLFTELPSMLLELAGMIPWDAIWEGIQDGASLAWAWLSEQLGKLPGLILRGLGTLLTTLGGWVLTAIPQVAETVAELAGSLLSWVIQAVVSLPFRLAELVGKIIEWAVSAGPGIAEAVAGLAGNLLSWVVSTIVSMPFRLAELAATIIGWIVELPGKMREAAGDLFGFLTEKAGEAIDSAVSFFTGLPDRLIEVAGDIADAALDIGADLIGGIVDGITSAPGAIADFAARIGAGLVNFVNDNVIDAINEGIPNKLGPINIPDNPLPLLPVPALAAGGVAGARPGGVLAQIAEGGRDELVAPLPDGTLEGLQFIGRQARSGFADDSTSAMLAALLERSSQTGPLQVIERIEVNEVPAGEGRGVAEDVILKLRREAFLRGKN